MATKVTPLVSGISLVYLYVQEIERSIAFYRDILGLPLEQDEHDPHWVEASLPGGIRFALHSTHEGVGGLGGGAVRVNFEVADIDAAAERLRAAGARVGEIQREQYGSHVDFVDPDGYHFDLFQPPA